MTDETYEQWISKLYDKLYLDKIKETIRELRELLRHYNGYNNCHDAGVCKGLEIAIDIIWGSFEKPSSKKEEEISLCPKCGKDYCICNTPDGKFG
jgi:hypothetical protein